MDEDFNVVSMDLDLYLGLPQSTPGTIQVLGSDLTFGTDLSLFSPMEIDPPTPDPPTLVGNNHMPHSPSGVDYTRQYPRSQPTEVETTPLPFTPTLPSLQEVEILSGPYTPSLPPPLPVYTEESIRSLSSSSNSTPSAVLYNGSSNRQDLLQFPESRFQRLIDSNNRLQARRFRSSVSHGLNRSDISSLSGAELLTPDVLSSHEIIRNNGKDKVAEPIIKADDSEDEEIEKRKSTANFECNICLDVAKEPVVTSCGHLFCWPCLYQWLHVHSGHKECPVCKGEVLDSNITPIYGRGSSDDKKFGDDDSDLKIPPRPHGHRLESFRQQLQRPILRRFGEGISASFRRFIDEELRSGVRFDGNRETSLLELLESHRRVLARMREQRAQRGDGNAENGSGSHHTGQSGNSVLNTQLGTLDSAFEDGENTWHRLTLEGIGLSERLAAISADLGRVVERLGGSNQAGTSTSADPRNHEPNTSRPLVIVTPTSDHVSASGTTPLIRGDVSLIASAGNTDGAGPSTSLRRRGRSRASSSLDVDGMLHNRKRRRQN